MNTLKQRFEKLTKLSPTRSVGGEGFYRCGHCQDVITPSVAQIEMAENAIGPDPAMKCPHCHKYTVHWQRPLSAWSQRPASVVVSPEHGRDLFAEIFRKLAKV